VKMRERISFNRKFPKMEKEKMTLHLMMIMSHKLYNKRKKNSNQMMTLKRWKMLILSRWISNSFRLSMMMILITWRPWFLTKLIFHKILDCDEIIYEKFIYFI
jgi:hypothetical protein